MVPTCACVNAVPRIIVFAASLSKSISPTEKFYRDPHKYALKLQLWILQQRYDAYVSAMRHMLTTGEDVLRVFFNLIFTIPFSKCRPRDCSGSICVQ